MARALGTTERKTLKGLMWGKCQEPRRRVDQTDECDALAAAFELEECALKSARANCASLLPAARADLNAWLSWARRCRLEPFKKLTETITERAQGVVRGMVDNRSNAIVEAMNGLLQHAKRAARGLRTASNFIAIACLRMLKLKHLPAHPSAPAMAK